MMKLRPEVKPFDADALFSQPPVHTPEALLESHVSYYKQLKRWFSIQHSFRVARYADRLAGMRLRIAGAEGPGGHPVSPDYRAEAASPAAAAAAATLLGAAATAAPAAWDGDAASASGAPATLPHTMSSAAADTGEPPAFRPA